MAAATPRTQSAHGIFAGIMSLFAIKGAYSTETATGTVTFGVTYPFWMGIDPGGAGRTVLLDAEGTSEGMWRVITNRADASEDLTVKEDSDTTTIGTISQNETGVFYCDGSNWTLCFIITGALS